jgi:MarR family transcriptional regulator, organic hydroperoxide resistance regulator
MMNSEKVNMASEEQSARETEQHKFCASFGRLNWEMHKHSMEVLERIGLTNPQLIVLIKLHDLEQPVTMCDLVRSTLQTGPTLTRIVDRLVAAGWVRRERDEHDRRCVYLSLTEPGQAKRREGLALIEHDIARLTVGLDDEELRQLNRLYLTLLRGMENLRDAKDGVLAHEVATTTV